VAVSMKFYLGTHHPSWLAKTDTPLFISNRAIGKRKSFPVAQGRWALDSGGFSELSMFGEWRTTEDEYATTIRRCAEESGGLDWAAPMDWMCEPGIIENTGKSVMEHQQRTIESVLSLRARVSTHIIPILQGWEIRDYWKHIEMYADYGIDLADEPTVGIGSVSRRQAKSEITDMVIDISKAGIRLHCFGFKSRGLAATHNVITSADSMAWSFAARRSPPLPGCVGHKHCGNCLVYAEQWYQKILSQIGAAAGREAGGGG
jgi:hypothetical protein